MNLYQIAPSEKLVKMMAGDKVVLKPQDSSLAVVNIRGEYLGLVPSKQGQRLIKLMDGGNKYTAAVVTSNENSISVIIRETYQDPSQIDQVSFPGKRWKRYNPISVIGYSGLNMKRREELGEAAAFAEEEAEAPEEAVEEVKKKKNGNRRLNRIW